MQISIPDNIVPDFDLPVTGAETKAGCRDEAGCTPDCEVVYAICFQMHVTSLEPALLCGKEMKSASDDQIKAGIQR